MTKHIERAALKRIAEIAAPADNLKAKKAELKAKKAELLALTPEYTRMRSMVRDRNYGPTAKKSDEAFDKWRQLKTRLKSLDESSAEYEKVQDEAFKFFELYEKTAAASNKEKDAFRKIWEPLRDKYEALEEVVQDLESVVTRAERQADLDAFVKQENEKYAKKGKKK